MRPVQVVRLSRRDSIDTLCEILRLAEPGAQVWFVAPWRMALLCDLVRLKRLARAAEDNAVDLRLVTGHLGTRSLARTARIPTYLMLPLWLFKVRRMRSTQALGLKGRLVRAPVRLSRRWERRPRQIGVGTAFLALIVVAVVLAGLAGTSAAILPSAAISVEPAASPIAASFTVTADPTYREADVASLALPARVVQVIVEGRGQTPATGAIDVADGHASGEVLLINRTNNAVKIPKGTIVRTGSGTNVRFATIADVELPAMQSANARVGIVALDAGLAGNVKALTINRMDGDAGFAVEVLNNVATAGGSVRQSPVVAAKDFDAARATLIDQLQKEAYAQLMAELEEGEIIPTNALKVEVMAEHFDQVIDQPSDVLSMSMKVVARGVAVSDQGLRDLALAFLNSRADEGLAVIPDSLSIQRSDEMRVDLERNRVQFDVTAQGYMAPVIPVDRIKSALRGKTVPQAQAWLKANLKLVNEPKITLEPKGWEYMPLLPGRVEVLIITREP